MTGDQCKNRFASSIVLDTTQDHYKVKRNKTGFSRYDLDLKSHISLKWDDSKTSVIAKTEQIGISRRELIPFADGFIPCHNILADVINVPPEIFRLDNLADVLTYEVWQNCLSESERSMLSQFLPKCSNPDRVVQQLFRGDNLHFGNPSLKWGALLCSGNLHPDKILITERSFRASKKAYYSELRTYHTNMIENLQIWRERATDCKDLKEDVVQRMWRSRNNSKKRVFTPEPGVAEVEENVYTTPESSCRGASEMVCSSDNPNGTLMHDDISGSVINSDQHSTQPYPCDNKEAVSESTHYEVQRPSTTQLINKKGSATSKIDKFPDGIKGSSELWTREKLFKHNIQHGDARYMSYIKVSKSQHQRIKSSMKHSSSSIQPKSLNSVLGNIDALHIQPFEVFEEEEWQKLHKHWLKLANLDLPPFVANRKNLQLQRLQITKSLGQEMEEKLTCPKESIDQNKESSCDVPLEPLVNLDANVGLTKMKELEVPSSVPSVEVPMMNFVETPLMIEEDSSAAAITLDKLHSMTEEEEPAMNEEEAPAMTEEESPAMTGEESPAMTGEESPAMTEEDSHPMKEEESPPLTEDESPPMIEEESCKLTKEDEVLSNESMEEQHDNVLGEVGLVTFEDNEKENSIGDPNDFVSVSTQSDHMHQAISLNNGFHHYTDMNIETHPNFGLEKDEGSPSSSKYPSNLGNIDVPVNQEDSMVSAVDPWAQVNMPSLFYHSTSLSHVYSSSNELALSLPQVDEQPSQLLRLDAFSGERIGSTDALHGNSAPLPFFSPFHNQDRNEPYQSFYKSETDLSYQHEQKQTGIDFQPAANLLVETGQFSGRMREQLHSSLPLELRQKGLNDFYLNQNIQENMYSDGGSYPIQRQETLPLHVRDWAANTANVSAPPQSHMNSRLLSQNWYAGDNPARGSWPCIESIVGPSQGIGSGSSSDQSLFRVLSECNELQLGTQYDPMSSTRRFMQSGSFGGLTGGVHTTSHILPPTLNSLNYLPDLDSTAGYKTITSLGMKNIQHQTPGLEDTVDSKTYLRSWNQ